MRMMGRETGREVRGRFRRDYPQTSDEKNQFGRDSSRHLWVGNVSHNINEATLSGQFIQFGELESVAFQPGRSYAFINFRREEDAISAMRELQGFPVSGLPLKIQFAKAEKSITPAHAENYLQRRDEQRSAVRESPFLQDSRTRHSSPDTYYLDNLRMRDKSIEPSEVLWVGFPTILKVDETILRKAFSPFGEVDKITTFPGRSYAFVQFRSVTAACRAKETLQGKLFGNPRVHICFSKSERALQNSGRNSFNAPPSPHFNAKDCPGSSDNFWQEKNFGDLTGDPGNRSYFNSDLEPEFSDTIAHNRKGNIWTGANSTFEQRRFPESGSELLLSEEDHRSNAARDGVNSSQKVLQIPPIFNDHWDLPEDSFMSHVGKKLKTGSFTPEKDLPDYPFLDSGKGKHIFTRTFSDFRKSGALDERIDSPLIYHKQPDHPLNSTGAHEERSNQWKTGHDEYPLGSGSMPSNHFERSKLCSESSPLPLVTGVWKWEGVIAKGGTSICRARCFPVGKVLDHMLPEFLDCTARTDLGMLAKHYYQASGAWIVFFVPGSDSEIGFYNEFMHYLEEKQRAAVAKLDDMTTLFLVPPSEFSENVLKVPGKLSISGVILKLEHTNPIPRPIQHLQENTDTSLKTSEPFPQLPSLSGYNMMMTGPNVSSSGNMPAKSAQSSHVTVNACEPSNKVMQGYSRQHSDMPPYLLQTSNLGARNIPSQGTKGCVDQTGLEYHALLPHQEIKTSIPSSSMHLQIQQLTQLTSSILGQQRHVENPRQTFTLLNNQPDNQFTGSQRFVMQDELGPSEISSAQYDQMQQWQQPLQSQRLQSQHQNQPSNSLNTSSMEAQQQEEVDGDPQKRLQATLQLAAALLQQIQQGKEGT